MIRSLSLLLISFLQFALVMASPFQLTLEVTPEESGSVYPGSGQFEAGNSIQLSAYPLSGFVFKGWYEGNKKLSSLSEFSYVMPAKNVVIQARFEFDPDVPDNPAVDSTELQQKEYEVEVVAKPEGTGRFNSSLFSGKAGSIVSIVPYPDSKYSFSHWENEKGEKLSSKDNLDYVIPHGNSKVYGVFEFDPPVPSNPGAYQWDAASGRLVLFEFKPGRIMSAINEAIGSSNNRSKVKELIVYGRMTSQDWGFESYLTNCATFDLSRTTGVDGIPDYGFDGLRNLQKIILPSCIEKIGYEAFYNCLKLTDIICYSITPPLVEEGAFHGVPQNAAVKVLPTSLGMYTEVVPWNTFTLIPMTDDTHALTLNLPAESADGRYKNMLLELVNQKSGQSQYYVVNDRTVYAFYGLMKGETFSLQLKTWQGVVLSELTDLTIGEEDLNVAFDQIQSLHQVTLKVTTPSGEDVTSKTQIVWTDANGIYLRQGASVEQLTANTVLNYAVTFDGTLDLKYKYPEEQNYVVQEKDNQLVLQLEPLARKTIFGQIKSKQGGAIEKAVVTVSQKVNGGFMQSFVTKTDREGRWSLEVFDGPTTIIFSANNFLVEKRELPVLGDHLDFGICQLNPVKGFVLNVDLLSQSASRSDQPAAQKEWLADYSNVSYQIDNVTQGCRVTDFVVHYPQIVILDQVADGDSLEVVANIASDKYASAETPLIIHKESVNNVQFVFKEIGAIEAKYISTYNTRVKALLYDQNGELVDQANYSEAKVIFRNLKAGRYTLVSMGDTPFYNSILRLSQLKEVGLEEGRDYVMNEVLVWNGVIEVVHNSLIPTFDESKFYYTAPETNFQINKSTITSGNYLTLSAQLLFRNEYAAKVQNVKLVVDLPSHTKFVDKSVLLGNTAGQYTLDHQRLVVPYDGKYSNRVKFCVIPTEGGDFRPNAFVEFTLDGKTILQPIGTAYCDVKDLSINVPSVIAENELPVSGTAKAHSEVTVYDGSHIIGQTTALGNGQWNTVCHFDQPYNLSSHNVYAKVLAPNGLQLKSATKECVFDKDAIRLKTVKMSYYNGWDEKNIEVMFDMLEKVVTPTSYSFFEGTDITFVLDFTVNDTSKISNVILNVCSENNKLRHLNTKYDAKLGKWVAVGFFGSGNLPIGVTADFVYKHKLSLDTDAMRESSESRDEEIALYKTEIATTDSIHEQIQLELKKENVDFGKVDGLIESFGLDLSKPSSSSDSIAGLDSLQLSQYITALDTEVDQLLSEIPNDNHNALINYSPYHSMDYDVDGNQVNVNYSRPNVVDSMQLINMGYVVLPTANGDLVFEKTSLDSYERIDVKANLAMKITYPNKLPAFTVPQNRQDIINRTIAAAQTLYNIIIGLEQTQEKILALLGEMTLEKDPNFKKLMEKDQKIADALAAVEKQLKPNGEFRYKLYRQYLLKQRAAISKALNIIVKGQKLAVKFVGSVLGPLADMIMSLKSEYDSFNEVNSLSVPYCLYQKKPSKAAELERKIDDLWHYTYSWYAWSSARAGLYIVGDVVLSETAVVPIVLTIIEAVGEYTYQNMKQKDFQAIYGNIKQLSADYKREYCKKKEEEEEPEEEPKDTPEEKPNKEDFYPTVTPIHDPAGYVYEGVSSNRLEGVMASCYYKELVEDMYGDKHENIVLWNAEDYAQKNPLFTDENGMYRWDVPQGLWQVKFEKEGYQTTYSDWLPVPPPQLEVNIPMTQLTQPMVVNARAYEEGVEVEFDKYMNPASFDLATVRVLKNGKAVDGTLKMLNEEHMNEYTQLSFASKIRFVPSVPFLGTDKVNLVVSRKVKSYAGITMAEDYSQEFDIVKEIKAIVADSICEVLYGGEREIVVSALPYDAAVGKTITAHTTSPMIATVTSEAVVDENGQARFTINGELPGAALLEFTIQDVTAQGKTEVNVVRSYTYLNAPKASLPSGTEVFKNTKVVLTSDRDDVVIYYTLNGSCPCDAGALVYKEPIVIDHDNVHIKAMAVDKEGNESAIVEFVYSIRTTSMAIDLATGWNWVSHNLDEAIELPQSSSVSRIRSQAAEAVNDPVSGWDKHFVMRPEEAYKIQATTEDWLDLSAYLFNARDKQISLSKGWNWMGYPMDQMMTVGEALAKAQPSLGDILVGFDGFAEYTAEGWLGTLEVMVPGQGYLYKAVNDGAFKYNTDIVSMAQSLHQGKNEPRGSMFYFDAHAYPDVMPITATLLKDGIEQQTDNYFAVALCGEDCRGEGVFVDGHWLFTVHGNGQEDINFVFIDKNTGEMVVASEAVKFVADNLGTYEQPFALHIGEVTGIEKQSAQGCTVTPLVAHDKIHVSLNGEQMDRVSLTSTNGRVVLVQQNCGSAVEVNVAELPSGTYVVTAVAGGKNYYKKIIKQ